MERIIGLLLLAASTVAWGQLEVSPTPPVVLDAELAPQDREIDSLVTQKRITELQADIAIAKARLLEAQKRSKGGAEATEEDLPTIGIVAISDGISGRSAVLATSNGERVRVRVGDAVAGLTIRAIHKGAIEVTDRAGTSRTVGFGTPVMRGGNVTAATIGSPVPQIRLADQLPQLLQPGGTSTTAEPDALPPPTE